MAIATRACCSPTARAQSSGRPSSPNRQTCRAPDRSARNLGARGAGPHQPQQGHLRVGQQSRPHRLGSVGETRTISVTQPTPLPNPTSASAVCEEKHRPSWRQRSDRHGVKPITLLIDARSLRTCGSPCADSMSARAQRRSLKMPDIRLQPTPASCYSTPFLRLRCGRGPYMKLGLSSVCASFILGLECLAAE